MRRHDLRVNADRDVSREIVQAQPPEPECHSAHIEYRTVGNQLTDFRFVCARRVQAHGGWNLVRNGYVKVLGLHLGEMVLKREH